MFLGVSKLTLTLMLTGLFENYTLTPFILTTRGIYNVSTRVKSV